VSSLPIFQAIGSLLCFKGPVKRRLFFPEDLIFPIDGKCPASRRACTKPPVELSFLAFHTEPLTADARPELFEHCPSGSLFFSLAAMEGLVLGHAFPPPSTFSVFIVLKELFFSRPHQGGESRHGVVVAVFLPTFLERRFSRNLPVFPFSADTFVFSRAVAAFEKVRILR